MIRYAWKGGLTLDLDQYWNKCDPSWQYIMDRTDGVPPSDWIVRSGKQSRTCCEANIPLGPYTQAYIEAILRVPADPKRRARDQERTLASVIDGQVNWLAGLLTDAGYKDATTRAREYLAPHWRKSLSKIAGAGGSQTVEALGNGAMGAEALTGENGSNFSGAFTLAPLTLPHRS